jgi:mycothiol synthase
MMAITTDERQLPAMYMVWPLNRLPAAPAGYVVRRCRESDLSAARAVVHSDEPVSDAAWESFQDRIVPGGAFVIAQADGGRPVATASASHNPRATRHYFPFGGEVGYVTVDPAHRGNGLGKAVVTLAVGRLIEAGYRHIFVGVQGWRLAAVKCYFGVGFVPLLHGGELLPRWQRICKRIGWPDRDAEWPRSLAELTGGGAGPVAATKRNLEIRCRGREGRWPVAVVSGQPDGAPGGVRRRADDLLLRILGGGAFGLAGN